MSKEIQNTEEEIIIYQADDHAAIDVHFNGETLWLSQQKIADLFQTSRTNVVEHIDHIYSEANWIKRQPVGISNKFAPKVVGK